MVAARHHLQVLRPIVELVVIDVMDNLVPIEGASQYLGHHNTMLNAPASTIAHGMLMSDVDFAIAPLRDAWVSASPSVALGAYSTSQMLTGFASLPHNGFMLV